MSTAFILEDSSDAYSSYSFDITSNQKRANEILLPFVPQLLDVSSCTNDTYSLSSYEIEHQENTSRDKKEAIQSSFIAEQEWEGYVTRIDSDFFYAQLLDLTNQGIEEEAQFELSEVSPNHDELLKEGALFRWSIGYERLRGGTRRRSSSIIFRRLPAWSKRELEESKQEAEQLIADIQWT